MDLWQVRKRYRLAAQHLRKSRGDEHARKAEAELIAVLSLGDRLETELALIKHAGRLLRGRLSRAVELLAGLVLGTFASRARVIDDLEHLKPRLSLEAVGVDLVPVLTQLEEEFAALHQREAAVRQRLTGLARVASEQLERFLRAARAGRLLTAMIADDGKTGDSDDQW